ncbi:hypothetical protein [Bordetella bronchiseptica]|uniref:hypothetical protein n=1 Tax=Bordetella bronchiseptica TaxID=518 RepID=UPI00191107A2|nr:hypothetical protein [Bordetella bronchiseptica]
MTEPLRGKVARILDTRHLVINLGSNHGVRVGMYFDVLDPKGEDIRDPDSGEVLGSIERPKVRVQVIKTEERLAVASTFRKKTVNVGGRGGVAMGSLAEMFLPPKHVTKYETLKTTETTWENLEESESYVKTGDPVIQVREEISESDGM